MDNIVLLHNKKVCLMPFGVVALAALEALKTHGISVVAILDNNVDIQGKTYKGTPILSPRGLNDIGIPQDGVDVIICNYIYERAMRFQLNELGVSDIYILSSIIDKEDENRLISCSDNIDFNEVRQILPRYAGYEKTVMSEIRKNLLPQAARIKDVLILPHTNLMITERCNLLCVNCSSWMQYFEHPKNYDFHNIKRGITALLDLVDYTRDIHILGGEPFLYPLLYEIVEYVSSLEKIGCVNIITNGTLVPRDNVLELMAQQNVTVRISDYGKVSNKKEQLIFKLEQYGVLYSIMENMTWYDYARYREEPLSLDSVAEQYRACPLNCMALSETMFSRCQIAMSAFALNALPTGHNDSRFADVIDVTKTDR